MGLFKKQIQQLKTLWKSRKGLDLKKKKTQLLTLSTESRKCEPLRECFVIQAKKQQTLTLVF